MRKLLMSALCSILYATPAMVLGGDEVDYSAPYMVVEDGELVTKYPAKDHDGAVPSTDEAVSDIAVAAASETQSGRAWFFAATAIAMVIVLLLALRRRRKLP